MKFQRWTKARIREPLMQFERGDQVVVIRSTVKYRSIEQTFWVMALHKRVLLQVSESAYGRGLYQLLEPGSEIHISKQEEVAQRAKGLMADTALAPNNVNRMTYLNVPDANLPKRALHVNLDANSL